MKDLSVLAHVRSAFTVVRRGGTTMRSSDHCAYPVAPQCRTCVQRSVQAGQASSRRQCGFDGDAHRAWDRRPVSTPSRQFAQPNPLFGRCRQPGRAGKRGHAAPEPRSALGPPARDCGIFAEREGTRTFDSPQLYRSGSSIATHVGLREGDRRTRTGLPPGDRHVSTGPSRSIRRLSRAGS